VNASVGNGSRLLSKNHDMKETQKFICSSLPEDLAREIKLALERVDALRSGGHFRSAEFYWWAGEAAGALKSLMVLANPVIIEGGGTSRMWMETREGEDAWSLYKTFVDSVLSEVSQDHARSVGEERRRAQAGALLGDLIKQSHENVNQ